MSRMVENILGLLLVASLGASPALAGGGSTSVHYLCGSSQLNLSFQLDGRPDHFHFHPGTQVLVSGPTLKPDFFSVVRFTEGEQVVMELRHPTDGQQLTVTWLGNSIIDGIRVTYGEGQSTASAEDGRCTPLD